MQPNIEVVNERAEFAHKRIDSLEAEFSDFKKTVNGKLDMLNSRLLTVLGGVVVSLLLLVVDIFLRYRGG